MPKFLDNRPTKVISVPSYPDAHIEIYDSLLVGDILGQDTGTDWEKAMVWIPRMIKSWDFTTQDDQPLPITSDSLKLFKAADMTHIMLEIQSFSQVVKKD